MTQLAQDSQIERIEAPSREDFMREFVQKNRPVVVTGIVDKWPAFTKWNPDYLNEVAGDSLVTVHYEEGGDFQRWYTPAGRTDKTIPLREFLAILTKEEPDRRYYMTEHDLRLVSPKLLADVDGSRYTEHEPRMFLGRDTCMPLHYHATTEAILCQLQGTKEILLYSPDQWSLLYAHPWFSPSMMFSRVDGPHQVASFTGDRGYLHIDAPDNDNFPRFKRAKPLVVRLEPGEFLLIPVHWWHLTTCPGFQVNVSMFWKSERSRHTYPQPGLQVIGHEMLVKLKRKLHRRKTRSKS